jgi:hypothetical protein
MSKLKKVVEIIDENIGYFNRYYNNAIFSYYKIKPINFDNIHRSLKDAVKIFYFSLTTRQRSRNNPIEQNAHVGIWEAVFESLYTLNDTNLDIEQRYFLSMEGLNNVTGAGQKIITMFIKFLIFHSKKLNNKVELEKILWVPLDVHLIKFLFTNIYIKNESYHGYQKTHRFRIFDERINQAKLNLSIDDDGSPNLNELFFLQKIISDEFSRDNIKQPPIILDNLWVIGSARCVYTKFSPLISCAECMFKGKYNKKRNICSKERV